MNLYCVIYELKTTIDYSLFYQKLRSFGSTNQFIKNGWFVKTNDNKEVIFDELKSLLGDSDLLLVTETPLQNMSGWLPSNSVEWLQTNPNPNIY